jgi:hypothetical protein
MEPPFFIAWENRSQVAVSDERHIEINRQNGRGAPAIWLSFQAMRGTYRIRLYSVFKEH